MAKNTDTFRMKDARRLHQRAKTGCSDDLSLKEWMRVMAMTGGKELMYLGRTPTPKVDKIMRGAK